MRHRPKRGVTSAGGTMRANRTVFRSAIEALFADPEVPEAIKSARKRRAQAAYDQIVRGYVDLRDSIGLERAHELTSNFLNSGWRKPPPKRGPDKKDRARPAAT